MKVSRMNGHIRQVSPNLTIAVNWRQRKMFPCNRFWTKQCDNGASRLAPQQCNDSHDFALGHKIAAWPSVKRSFI